MSPIPMDEDATLKRLLRRAAEDYEAFDTTKVVRESARSGRRRKTVRTAIGGGFTVAAVLAAVAVQAAVTAPEPGGTVVAATSEPNAPNPLRSLGGAPPPVSDWQPTTPLSTQVHLTEAQKLRKRERFLAADADAIGLPRPTTVDLIRWITPEEWAPVMLGCLIEQGFDVDYTADGGINSARVTGVQNDALQLATHVCAGQYTIDPRFSVPLNDEQVGIVYDFLTTSYVPCLGGLGIDVSPPPSRAEFIATGDEGGWMPQVELPRDSVTEVNATCAIRPRSDVLYGR